MPNQYDPELYMMLGMSPDAVARHSGVPLDEATMYHDAMRMRASGDVDSLYAALSLGGDTSDSVESLRYLSGKINDGTVPRRDPRLDLLEYGQETLREDIEANKPWYHKYVLDPGLKAIQTIAIPQQAMYRWFTGTDIRKAVPEFLQKEAWKNEGIAHEFLDIGDVIDLKTDSSYKALLEDLEADGGFKKWVVGNGLKVAEFGVDVALDPTTYLAGLGIGGKVAGAFRRTLPVGARTALESRIAFRTGNLVNVEEAIKTTKKLIEKVAGVDEVAHKKAVANLTELLDQKARLLTVKEGFEAVPHRMPQQIKDLTPEDMATMTRAEIAEHNARKRAAESMEPLVTWRHLDDEEIAARAILGPEDSEIAGEGLRVLFNGGDVDDVIVRNVLDGVEPTRYAGNVEQLGIGVKGQIPDEVLRSQDVYNEIIELNARRQARLAEMEVTVKELKQAARRKPHMLKKAEQDVRLAKKEVRRLGLKKNAEPGPFRHESGKFAKKEHTYTDLEQAQTALEKAQAHLDTIKNATDESIEKMAKENVAANVKALEELRAAAKTTESIIAHRTKYGVLPEWVGDMKGLKNPWGPRRDLFKTTDWLENRYAQGFTRVWGRSLYPGAHFPKLPFLTAQLMFREPMRILDERMPGAWDFMRGKIKTRDFEVEGAVRKFEEIFHEAGILEYGAGAKKSAKFFGLRKTPAKLNRERNDALFDLLDTVKGSDDWEKALAKHGLDPDDALIAAHDKVRVILDDYADRLGLAKDERIEGYISHFLKQEFFEGGRRPDVFNGARGVGRSVAYFLRDRTAADIAYNPGAIESLELYVRAVAHHMYTRPMLHELDKMVANHVRLNPKDKALLRWSKNVADALEGRPSAVGQFLNDFVGMEGADKIRKWVSGVTLLTYGAAMAGNPRYPIMSLLQSFNTTSANFGTMNSLRGIFRMLTPEGRALAKSMNLGDEHLRLLSDAQSRLGEIIGHARLPGPSIADTEYMIRGMTMHASISKQMSVLGFKNFDEIADAGMQREIVAQAVKDSEHVNHVFGVLGRPTSFNRLSKTGSVAATQFMSFPFKQTETLYKSAIDNGVMGFAWDYLVMAGQMAHTFHKANLMVDEYVGLNYAVEPFRYNGQPMRTSLPLTTIAKSITAFQAMVNPAMDSLSRQQAGEDFLNHLESMSAFARQLNLVKQKMVTGEVRTKDDSLVRHANMSLVQERPGMPGSELAATLFGLKTYPDDAIRRSREITRNRQQEARAKTEAMAREAHKYVQEGRPIPITVVSALQRDLLELGIIKKGTDIRKLLSNDVARYNIIERVRNFEADSYSGLMASQVIGETR